MKKHVYFVRHGESEENVTRVHLGSEAPLTEQGQEQAQLVAERIQRIGVDAVITSPFSRARDTAAAIAEKVGCTLEENDLLGEWREPSETVGLHIDDPVRKDIRANIHAAVDDHEYRHSDEETFAELAERARKTLAMLEARPEERLCVVTHGGFLRALVGVITFGEDFTKKEFQHILQHFYTHNTGITYIPYDPEKHGWRIITWNDQVHLG